MMVDTSRGGFSVRTSGGSGPAVVMLHPLALSGEVWRPLMDHLSPRCRTFAIDARGHGNSGWDGHAFTVDDMAADAAGIIEALDVGAVHVVGLSMGASTAIVLAATYPELVDRLVLADGTACYGPDRVRVWEQRAQSVLTTSREGLAQFQLDRWFSPDFLRDRPDEADRVLQLFLATDAATHAAACRALGGLDATTLLPKIQASTLVVVGADDYATPPSMARKLASEIGRARLHELPGTRHMSLVERPEVWPLLERHLGVSAGDVPV